MSFENTPSPEFESHDDVCSTSSTNSGPSPAPNGELRQCSYCRKSFDPTGVKTMPFCSSRCQQIDLGNWLTERYGFPLDGHEDLPDQPDSDSDQ